MTILLCSGVPETLIKHVQLLQTPFVKYNFKILLQFVKTLLATAALVFYLLFQATLPSCGEKENKRVSDVDRKTNRVTNNDH